MNQALRRRFFKAAMVLIATPSSVLAQRPASVRRIGFLSLDTSASVAGQQALQEFPQSLRRLGYRLDSDLFIEWRWADGRSADLDTLARSLVALNVDVIVARTNAPIQAAKRATRTIPIVMLNGNFPVESGLVESFAKPGGNITGTAYISPETVEKQVQLLKETAPGAARVAVILNAHLRSTPYGRLFRDSMDRAAARLGMTFRYSYVRRPEDVSAALDNIAASGTDAFFFVGDPVLRTRTDEIMAFLRNRKMISLGTIPRFAESGGLLHYAPDVREFFDRTASYVDRILKGAKPSDLSLEQPTKFELVVNLKTAKALGISVPQSILLRADRVIE